MDESAGEMEAARMDWSDYSVFTIMLAASALIGIYFGCFGSKQKDPKEYLLGGKSMRPIPVALSLVASFVSGSTLIAVPAEVYSEGCTYWVMMAGFVLATLICYYFIIPIFYDINVDSAFEYLELRYDKTVRSIASFLYCLAYLLFLPAVIYIPSLVLSQASGVNVHLISAGVTAVCIFYTMIGGLKAVIWTDFLQLIMTIIATIAIVAIGTNDNGGISNILKISYDDGKLNIFNMDPNPFQRTTFWTMFIGSFVMMVFTMGFHQGAVQRYLCLSSRNDITLVLFVCWFGFTIINTFCIYSGLVAYVSYYGCDPVAEKLVSNPDLIFPYYMLDKIGYIPTLPGFFIAGVFSAALSTLSTGFNTIAGTIYEDYIKQRGINPDYAHIIMKVIVLIIGIFSIAMVFVIEKMGRILSAIFIITSITAAPVYVMFVMGIFMPRSNKAGVLVGSFASMIFVGWIAIGSSLQKVNFITKDVYPIDTCPSPNVTIEYHNITISQEEITTEDDTFILYKLSFMLYTTFGLIVGLIFGVPTCFITGLANAADVDPKLISPPLRRFLPKSCDLQKIQEEKLVENILKETNTCSLKS